MKKIRNGFLILSGLVVLITVIFIVRYLLTDEPLWESPYDKELIDQKIVLDLPQDNLDLLLLQVGEYVEKWTGQQRLISCNIYVNNMGINRRYCLVYDIGSIDDYIGVCEVDCCLEDEKWVVESAENRYTQDGNAEKTALHIQEVQEKYEASLTIMRDNAFWKGTDCLLLIRADMASVTVFGTNERNERCILERIILPIPEVSDLYQMEKEEGIYRLTVKDRTGKDILNEEYQVEPTIMTVNDNTLLRICGRGDWHTYKFMNVSTGMVSEEFDDASAWTAKLVIYAVLEDGVNKIVIRDIYNKEDYYKEIERDFSPMAIPHHIIKRAEFLNNTKLVLQYYCGDDLEIKEESIIL